MMTLLKKIKAGVYAGILAVLTLTAVSCSNEIVDEKKSTEEVGDKFEVALWGNIIFSETNEKASIPSTRVETRPDETCGLKTSWKMGDKITVGFYGWNDEMKTVEMTVNEINGGVAKFTGEVSDYWDKQKFQESKLFVVNNETDDKISVNVENNHLKVTIDFSGQDGKPESIANYDLLYAEGKADKSLNFSHKIAVMQLALQPANGSAAGNFSDLSIFYMPREAGESTALFAGTETFKFGANPEEKYEPNNFLTMSATSIAQDDDKARVYVAVPSNEKLYGKLSVEANFENETYRKELNLKGQAFTAQHVVAKNIILKLSERVPKVGDYLYNDGTWGPLEIYTDKFPVALVFSNYTSEKDRQNGFKHGYAMALRDAAWPTAWGPEDTDYPETPNLFDDIQTSAPLAMMNNLDGYTTCKMLNDKYLKDYTWENHYANHVNTAAIPTAMEYGTAGWRQAFTDVQVDVPTPTNTSGWYLPSTGQWFLMFLNLAGLNANNIHFGTDSYGKIYTMGWSFSTAEEKQSYLNLFAKYFSTTNNPVLKWYEDSHIIPQSGFYLPYNGQIDWYEWCCDEASSDGQACVLRLDATQIYFTKLWKTSGGDQQNGYAARPVIAF
ncbi:MAG: hypothetical protein ACTTJK_04810 [Phocaeicola sp.]|uniref:hypothetical protein n=1 Tax=Phocaeicola sp. TaxID=2773926 RepID=UPI003F9FF46E